ncbi:anti-sigma factor [Streptomyces sp. HPF1205]|uniref:anti-sigma factor family protein n=1 Tax=Streptomyces sp. HPF1205 TaxID=2873262 RepID=UPI001CEDFCD9|nr:hypothetical protein [Streptomyces sp. HPF1205]
MTSTKGTDAHPEVDEISSLSEGLLAPERAAEVREHLADCDLCADVLASLEDIRGLLGDLPEPERMPDDIVGRIDAALAAEAHLAEGRAGVPRGTPVKRETPVDVPRGTPTAPAGRSDAPTGPGGRAGTPAGPGRTSGGKGHPAGLRRRGRTLIASVSAVAALALGGIVYAAVESGSSDASQDSSVAASSGGSGVSAQVGSQVRHLLGDRSAGRANTPMFSDRADGTPYAPDKASPVPACVLKATHRIQQPLATAREPFQGTDAYLVVLPHPGSDRTVDAYVVNASCSSTSPGTVLFRATYAR